MSDRIVGLEARLSQLESESKVYRLLAALCVAMATAAFAFAGAQTTAAQTEKGTGRIEGREIVLRDDAGNMIFYVGPKGNGTVLFLVDRAGKVTARLPSDMEILPIPSAAP